MTSSRRTILPRGALLGAGLTLGLGLGVLVGVLWFVVEAVWIHAPLRPYYGTSMWIVWALYLAFGMAMGLLSGALGGILAAAGAPETRTPRLVPYVAGVLGAVYTLLFLLRDYTLPQLRIMPPGLVATVLMAALLWASIIVTGGRIAQRRRLTPQTGILRTGAIAAFLLVVVSGLVAGGVTKRLPRTHAARDDLPDVYVITVDALRADHLGAYGYYRPTSPRIDEFAREGVLFENAYAHGNRTILSMPSLFTSLYPSFHGAVGIGDQAAPLPQDRTTIAEMLHDAGYTTVGLMSNVYLKRPFGLTQGFDRVEEFNAQRFRLSVYRALETVGILHRPLQKVDATPYASGVTDKAIEWIGRAGDRPIFLFAHYMDVHHPYMPSPETFEEFDRHTSTVDPTALFLMTAAMVENPPPLPIRNAELQRLVDLYDACIHDTDEQIGRLLDAVRSRSESRPAIVVITADHGDEFMEHGSLYHNNLLVEELIRVPLVFWSSTDRQPRRVVEMVRHIDVMPTIAELCGVPAPQSAMGTSIAGSVTGGEPPAVAESVSEGDFCMAINTPDWKIMHVDSSDAYYLYDLSDDPWGHDDVADGYPEVMLRMRSRIDWYRDQAAAQVAKEPVRVNEDTLRQLRALGYIQ